MAHGTALSSPDPLMVHLYLCLPDRCGQKIHKSKGDRQCYFLSTPAGQAAGRQRYKCTIRVRPDLCMQRYERTVTYRNSYELRMSSFSLVLVIFQVLRCKFIFKLNLLAILATNCKGIINKSNVHVCVHS